VLTGIFVFIFGLIVGSFLNVVIIRYGNRFFSSPRSECFSCSHPLAFFDLIPVLSFLFLGGRCRYCQSKISWQYPLVELLTALLLLFSYLKLGFSPEFFFSAPLWLLFLSVSAYDLRHKIIPDGLVYALIIFSFGYMFFFRFEASPFLSIFSGPVIASPFLFLWLISDGRWMGFGDVKLALSIGWFLGLAQGFYALVFAFWVGALVGLFLIFLKKTGDVGLSPKLKNLTIKSEIPFAPFLIIGTLIVFFLELSPLDIFLL